MLFQAASDNGSGAPDEANPLTPWTADVSSFNALPPGALQFFRYEVDFDLDAFTRATGRRLNEEEKDQFRRAQLQANRWTYLGSGMTHERVLATLGSLSPAARKRVEEVAQAFC